MEKSKVQDGVHSMVPREQMCESAQKLRDTYELKPDIPFFKGEFGYNSRWGVDACYYCLEQWRQQGLPEDADMVEYFDYDLQGSHCLGQLGACEAEFEPYFEDKVVEDRGKYEVIQDIAGRYVLVFKGRRQGFMPEYIDHPVKDMKSWEENAKWRLDPKSGGRYLDLEERMQKARIEAAKGKIITQDHVGAYMYLRSLIGPEKLLYAFHDMPDVIHECMKAWLELSDHVIAQHQQYVTIDEIFFDEDICYNHGPLISPDMMREFLFPYYQQLIGNLRSRQIDKTRNVHIQVDSDGYVVPIIELYHDQIGLNVMSPFEVASGCDAVAIGRLYPDLVMTGGIDKRVLAEGKEAIDEHLGYILPTMRKRGGYIPTCDHGVPAEVSLDNYVYYRRRTVELGA
ncbi:MAG: hypothetical protein JRJ09_12650 [Deltaproteobacteria bacterium]|nr:hypothetical protein [Deltaproteobacteria bacterium]